MHNPMCACCECSDDRQSFYRTCALLGHGSKHTVYGGMCLDCWRDWYEMFSQPEPPIMSGLLS